MMYVLQVQLHGLCSATDALPLIGYWLRFAAFSTRATTCHSCEQVMSSHDCTRSTWPGGGSISFSEAVQAAPSRRRTTAHRAKSRRRSKNQDMLSPAQDVPAAELAALLKNTLGWTRRWSWELKARLGFDTEDHRIDRIDVPGCRSDIHLPGSRVS